MNLLRFIVFAIQMEGLHSQKQGKKKRNRKFLLSLPLSYLLLCSPSSSFRFHYEKIWAIQFVVFIPIIHAWIQGEEMVRQWVWSLLIHNFLEEIAYCWPVVVAIIPCICCSEELVKFLSAGDYIIKLRRPRV